MRRKNVFEFCILGLFIMCIGLALSAALEYVTVGSEREYLGQGKWLLSLLCIVIASFFSVRLAHKAGGSLGKNLKNAMAAGACAMFFMVGLWLRLWVIANIPVEPDSDFETYFRMATELYNDTMLTPAAALDRRYAAMYPHTIGFPMLILLPAFKLAGPSVEVALYANLVCSMVSVLIAGHIGKKLAGKIGLVLAVALMSLWPSHILFSNMVATEQSFTMMILLAADIMVHVMDRGHGSLYELGPARGTLLLILLGAVLALSGAIRPMAIVLLAAWAVVQLFIGGDPKGEIPQTGSRWILARGWMCVLLVAIPYLLVGNMINKTITDIIMVEPASGISASGYNLMVGVNTASGGRWNDEDARFFGDIFDETGDANAAHQACMQKAIERVTQAPEDVLNLLVYKFRDLWQTDDFGVDWNLQWTDMQGTLTPEIKSLMESIRPTGRVMYMAVLLFALIGAIEAWRRHTAPQPMLMVNVLFFLGTALAHMLLETQVRYHYNMIPFLILLGVQAVASWRERMAEEPAVKLVPVPEMGMEEVMEDHTNFDMHTALREGHVHMSVSEAVAERSAQHSLVSVAMADDAEDEVSANAEEAAESAVPDTEEDAEAVTEEAPAEAETEVEEAVEETTEETADDAEAIAEEEAEEAAESAETEATVEEVAEEALAEVEESCAAVEEEEASSEIADTEEPAEAAPESEAETATEDEADEVAEADVVVAAAEDDTAPEDAEEVPAEIASEADDVIDEVAETAVEESIEAAAEDTEEVTSSEEAASEEAPVEVEASAEEPMEEAEEAAVEAVANEVETEAPTEEETEEEAPVEPEAVDEEAPAETESNEEPEPEVQLEEVAAEPKVPAAKAPATDLAADVDVLPMAYAKPVRKQPSAAQGKSGAAKLAAKRTSANTALKTPRAPAKRQKLAQQDRVQRTVERRKAVARRKHRRQRQAARR